MARDLFNRYVWIVDTIRRYGAITREELDECWKRSSFSQGDPLPRRTFFNYRAAIEELFKINIIYDPHTLTYSIEEVDQHNSDVTDWVLNATALTNVLADSREVADLIFLEDVPSAREFLPDIITALKERHRVTFDYHPYTRRQPHKGISVEPYFLKIFRQRWYLTGRNVAENSIKTYALDRMSNLLMDTVKYDIPPTFDPNEYFRNSYGIIFNQGEVKNVVLKVDPRQAKYLRALPLHHSQSETVSDDCSYFSYRLKISEDFVQELLSLGPKATVMAPPELRAIMTSNLRESLKNYEDQQ